MQQNNKSKRRQPPDPLLEQVIRQFGSIIGTLTSRIGANLYLSVAPADTPLEQEQAALLDGRDRAAIDAAVDTQQMLLCLTELGAASTRHDKEMLLSILEEWRKKVIHVQS